MVGLRKNGRPVSVLMIALALLVSIPHQAAIAALVDTEPAVDSDRLRDTRVRLHQYLAREDIRAALRSQRIDPLEAEARVASLTDAEIT
jgi:predicted NAD/FAD-binding protein